MKTIPEILAIMNKKIEEHKREVEAASTELESLKKGVKPGIENAMKQLVLKDKVLFHKAAGLALNDLKESIK